MTTSDTVVVGAGPAGLAAAVTAADHGQRVALVDAAPQLGGQYWRHPDETAATDDPAHGHHGWATYTDLSTRLRRHLASGRVEHLPGRQVWFVEPHPGGFSLHTVPVSDAEAAPLRLDATSLVLCPGGYDRQLPVPGWDRPGVMAAGGVQALIKAHRTLAGRRAVVAGTGPFLLSVAKGLSDAGAEVVAVCEANDLRGWLRTPWRSLAVPGKAVEGAEYAAHLVRHRIPYRTRSVVSAITGEQEVTGVELSTVDADGTITGPAGSLDVDLVALGWGFTPSLELITGAGGETRIDIDGSLVAVVDDHQRGTVPGLYVAGEATGVGGAVLAVAEGRLAGLAVALDHGGTVPAQDRRAAQRRVARHRRFATVMHRAAPVPQNWAEWLTPETVVCRCEEVSYADVCHARDELGATDARTVKLLARTGMGWCQGRVCGFATALLAAAAEDRPLTADDLRPQARQHLTTPVALGVLAGSEPHRSEEETA